MDTWDHVIAEEPYESANPQIFVQCTTHPPTKFHPEVKITENMVSPTNRPTARGFCFAILVSTFREIVEALEQAWRSSRQKGLDAAILVQTTWRSKRTQKRYGYAEG